MPIILLLIKKVNPPNRGNGSHYYLMAQPYPKWSRQRCITEMLNLLAAQVIRPPRVNGHSNSSGLNKKNS
jgi:hypothetical protein